MLRVNGRGEEYFLGALPVGRAAGLRNDARPPVVGLRPFGVRLSGDVFMSAFSHTSSRNTMKHKSFSSSLLRKILK